jgi:hypothetical protein
VRFDPAARALNRDWPFVLAESRLPAMRCGSVSLPNLRRWGRKQLIAALALVAAILPVFTGPSRALAGEADVIAVEITRMGDGTYRFDVTVGHDDAGWAHYADKWQVLDLNGTVLGERVLLHPHDNEQPFTRSLAGVKISDGTGSVIVRAHDKMHGWGGKELKVDLPD